MLRLPWRRALVHHAATAPQLIHPSRPGARLGAGVGVCVGDRPRGSKGLEKTFMLSLQMTVLPYITLSLITGLGRLRYQDVTMLALKVGALLLGSWVLALATILLMPLAFPPWEDASFSVRPSSSHSSRCHGSRCSFPSNPFHALANNLVPAVVLFSIAVGVALIGLEEKHGLLKDLALLYPGDDTGHQRRVSAHPARRVFAIVASAAGTMNIEEIGRVQILRDVVWHWHFSLTFLGPAVRITSASRVTHRAVGGADQRRARITAFPDRQRAHRPGLPGRAQQNAPAAEPAEYDDTEAAVEVIFPPSPALSGNWHVTADEFLCSFAGWFAGAIRN